MEKRIKLVIFDMDGLMFDTERMYYTSVENMFEEKAVKVDMQAYRKVIGTAEVLDMRCFNQSSYSDEKVMNLLLGKIDLVRNQLCREGVPAKKGLYELLEILQKKGIKKVVATSTSRSWTEKFLDSAGIREKFDFIITREDVKEGKPNPDIFLQACELEGVSVQESLVLEDSWPGGMAAKKAGIDYIIVPDMNPPKGEVMQSAVKVADSLCEVAEIWKI